jgi:hypothetical protein
MEKTKELSTLRYGNDGYVYVGKIPQHRLVVEEYIGRKLTKEERIHHLNEIKSDNRIENLMLFPNDKEHIKFHNAIRRWGYTNPILKQIETRWDFLKKT